MGKLIVKYDPGPKEDIAVELLKKILKKYSSDFCGNSDINGIMDDMIEGKSKELKKHIEEGEFKEGYPVLEELKFLNEVNSKVCKVKLASKNKSGFKKVRDKYEDWD